MTNRVWSAPELVTVSPSRVAELAKEAEGRQDEIARLLDCVATCHASMETLTTVDERRRVLLFLASSFGVVFD